MEILVIGGHSDWMILEVFSNLGDSMILLSSICSFMVQPPTLNSSCGFCRSRVIASVRNLLMLFIWFQRKTNRIKK